MNPDYLKKERRNKMKIIKKIGFLTMACILSLGISIGFASLASAADNSATYGYTLGAPVGSVLPIGATTSQGSNTFGYTLGNGANGSLVMSDEFNATQFNTFGYTLGNSVSILLPVGATTSGCMYGAISLDSAGK
jgi:hypothetical protein